MAKRKGFKSWFIDRARICAIKIGHHKRIANSLPVTEPTVLRLPSPLIIAITLSL